ncbi:hypothetical protein D3C86_1301790 [compost metagenome]
MIAPLLVTIVTVSKNASDTSSCPFSFSALAKVCAKICTREAMAFSPLGPWNTAYIAAILASNACAVQILEVAFSRLMCCSRVCKAIRKARPPCASILTPMIRPGMLRLNSSLQVKNAACGPPNPSGTPKRCAEPKATSAPSSPGGVNNVRASRSVAKAT